MSEMRERVAVALWSLRPAYLATMHWDDAGEGWRNEYRQKAITAIAAMREPTEAVAMAAVGESPIKRRDEIAAVSVGAQLWRDAIDAALEET